MKNLKDVVSTNNSQKQDNTNSQDVVLTQDVLKFETTSSETTSSETTNDETISSETTNTEIILPLEVTAEPRNEEEMHMDLLNNQAACDVYIQVSDDSGEVLGDIELYKSMKEFVDQSANQSMEEVEDPDIELERAEELIIPYTQQLNRVDSRFAGTIAGYRILQGRAFNIIKSYLKATSGPTWLNWYDSKFQGHGLRTVQDYMRLAKIPGIIRYAVFGKERLIEIARQFSTAEKRANDPIGAFIERKGLHFNPEESVDLEELKIQTDIAIVHEKCLKAGIDIRLELIERLVRNGKEIESKHIKELKGVYDLGNDIDDDTFEQIMSSDGRTIPGEMTAERKSHGFKRSTARFIKEMESAIEDEEYRGQLDLELIGSLKDKLQQLEELIQRITENTEVDTANEAEADGEQLPSNQGGN